MEYVPVLNFSSHTLAIKGFNRSSGYDYEKEARFLFVNLK